MSDDTWGKMHEFALHEEPTGSKSNSRKPDYGIGKYRELRIPLGKKRKPYLDLFRIFFDAKNTLKEFDRIFPEDPDYLDNHKNIPENRDFLPWDGWLFRGHRQADWNLQTKFERQFFPNKESLGNDVDFAKIEEGMIREFDRQIGATNPNLRINQKDTDYYEALANMQHFGCATRLLDVSFSFFVALFFAIEGINPNECKKSYAKEDEKDAFSIWCFNRMWIEKRYKDFLPEHILQAYAQIDSYGKAPSIQKIVMEYVPNLREKKEDISKTFLSVINTTPYFMNTRIVRQRGSFLFPTNPYRTFEENLFNMVRENTDDTYRILKITVEYDYKTLIYLQKFLAEMNINHAVLFGDMEGICKGINFKANLNDDSLTFPKNKPLEERQ